MYGAGTWVLKKAQENKLMCRVTRLDNKKGKNKKANKSGGNHKESPGKDVEVVWACDEKRGTLRRKEGNGNESTGEKEERKT